MYFLCLREGQTGDCEKRASQLIYYTCKPPQTMAASCSFGEFDSSKEDWQSYTERQNHYIKARDIVDKEKK